MDERHFDEPEPVGSDQPEPAKAGQNAPLGGDTGTENELKADNAVEEDMLKALDPDAAPG